MSVVDSQTFKPKIRAVARKSTSKPPRVWINGKSSPNTTDGGKTETSSSVVSSSDRPVSMDTVNQPEVLDRNVSTDTIRNHNVLDRNGDSSLQEPNSNRIELDEKVEEDSGITGLTGLDNSDTVSCDTDELLDNGVESGKDEEMESIEEINSTQLSTDNGENILTISDSDTSMDTNNPAAKVTEEKTLPSSPVAMGVKVRNSVRDIMSKIVQVAGPEVNKILSRPKSEDTERDGGLVSIKPSTEAKSESKTISGKPLKENLFEIMSAEPEPKQLVDSPKTSQRIDSEVLNKNRPEKQELFYDQSRATTLADSNSPDTTAHRNDLHPVTLTSEKPFTTNACSDKENKSCSVPSFDNNSNNSCESFEASFENNSNKDCESFEASSDNNSNNDRKSFEASFGSNSNKDCKSFEASSVESSNNNCKSLGNNGKFSGNNSKGSVASLDNDSNEDISEIVSNLDDNSQSKYSNISDIDEDDNSREVSEMEVDNVDDDIENSENLWESVISVESTLKSKSHMVEASGDKSKIRQNISSVEDRDANPSIAISKNQMTHFTSSLDNCDTTSECSSVSKSSLVNQDSKCSGDELKKEEKKMTGNNVGTETEEDQKQDVKSESKLVLKSEIKKEMTDEECLVKSEDSKINNIKTETESHADKIPKTENSVKLETKDMKTESLVKAEKVLKMENTDSEVKSGNVETENEKIVGTPKTVTEKIGATNDRKVTEKMGVEPESSKDTKQSKDPLTEKIGFEPESSKDRIQSKETVTESMIGDKRSIETVTESVKDKKQSIESVKDEKQSMESVKDKKQSMETVMDEKQTKETVTESLKDKKLVTVTEPLKDKKRLMESSDSDSPAPLKRSRLDIMIGKLGDQIGIPPDTVPDPIDCDDDTESEGEEESEEEEEDGVKTEEDTEDGVGVKTMEDDVDGVGVKTMEDGVKTMEDGVKTMEDEEDGVKTIEHEEDAKNRFGVKTAEDKEDAKNRLGVKTAEDDAKNRFKAEQKKNSSKAKDGDRDETKNSLVEKEKKVCEESKNPGNQGQKSKDGVTTTSEKEEVVLLKIDTAKEKGDKGKVKSPEVSMVIDDDDDVTVIEPVPEKQPERNREIYYDKNTDLEKIIRERVLQMFKTYRNEKIEDLERRIAALNEMNDKWKATAKELQKQVVDLTVVQHRLDKRKAATAALKMINSRTIGCQVDTTKIQSTDTAGQMVTKSPQKPAMLSQNQFTFSSVPIQTVTTPNMVSMIKRPNMVPVNNVSQLLSATAVSRTSLSTPSSSSSCARLPLHTSVRNLLETSGKNAKTTPGPAASQLLKQVSRGIGGSTPGAKVIDLTADEDQNKKMASSKGSSTQVTMVPMSALPNTNLGQTILRPLTSGSTIPPGASILLSGPTGTQFVNQTSLNRMAATGNLQVMQVSGTSASGIRPGSLLTVVPSSTTGGASTPVYPQSLTFSSPSSNNKPIVVDTGKFRPSAPPLQTSVVSLSTPVPQKNIITPPILKHPAALPAQPVNKTPAGVVKGIVPPKPDLKISRVSQGIVLSWTITQNLSLYSEISSYQLFAYQEGSSPPSSTLWKKVGDVKALPLPMACTLTQFQEGNKYHFAVRAVDVYSRVSEFSEPSSIHLFPKSS